MTTPDFQAIIERLDALTADVRLIRTDLDVTFKRMAAMQAELDLLPTARRRREVLRPSQPPALSGGNGHG